MRIAHQVVPIFWFLCSLSRLVMAAAVSSTERRVTSMVGQPRRSNARRAHVASASGVADGFMRAYDDGIYVR